jgi:hypothetical protein
MMDDFLLARVLQKILLLIFHQFSIVSYNNLENKCCYMPPQKLTVPLLGLGISFRHLSFKSIIFWDMTLGSLLRFNRRFGGTYRLHLRGQRNKFSKNQQASGKQNNPPAGTYFFDPEDGGDMFLRNVG